jgi:hypothetical protein
VGNNPTRRSASTGIRSWPDNLLLSKSLRISGVTR